MKAYFLAIPNRTVIKLAVINSIVIIINQLNGVIILTIFYFKMDFTLESIQLNS